MTPAVMVAIELVCMTFLLVILAAYVILPRATSLKDDGFFFNVLLTVLAIFFDIHAWACELGPSPAWLQYASNFAALVMASFIVSSFSYYIIDLINERQPLSKTIAYVISAVNAFGVIVPLIAGFFDKLYYIHPSPDNPTVMIYDDGGLFYECPILLYTLSLVFLFGLVIRYSKVLGKKRLVVFTIFFLLPMTTGVLEMIYENFQLSYVATSVSLSIVYTMLQSSRMEEMTLREEVLNELSFVDQLTGLLNRRACDRDVEAIKEEDDVSVVFCDLNGLKKINDEKGHHAGDLFLISFSKILLKYFSQEFVYRISGDEFLIVARNMDKDEFEKNIELLKEEIDENAGIAALGTITGTGGEISALVKKAENNMYNNKKEFYRKNPAYRR